MARGKARTAILQAVNLSAGARLLYLFLDDMDWNSQGIAWPKQTTVAAKIGFSTREVQRCLAELTAASHVRVERKKAHCLYRLTWSDTTARSYPKTEHTTARSHPDTTARSYPSLIETIETEPTCPGLSVEKCQRCAGEGWYLYETTIRRVRSSNVVLCGCRPLSLEDAQISAQRARRAS